MLSYLVYMQVTLHKQQSLILYSLLHYDTVLYNEGNNLIALLELTCLLDSVEQSQLC